MSVLTFEITGGVNVSVMVTEQADGSLKFDLTVLDDTGSIGDLNGLFFDLSDDSIADSLSVSGTDITGENIDANSVTKVDGYNNVNGEVAKDYGKFDIGVQFGTSGMAADDIQETSFILTSSDGPLTLDTIFGQDFAVRLTSVGEADGARDDSLKLGGTALTEPDEPEGPIDPEGPEEPAPTNTAINDSLTVFESEDFNFGGPTDVLDGGATSVLTNDLTDADPYQGVVTDVGGADDMVGTIIAGSNGGLMVIYPDGSLDFAGNGDFNALNTGESTTTDFTYEIEGGSTATITVTVEGESDGGEPPIIDPPIIDDDPFIG